MNDYVCIGKIINTFGIKGEVKIASDFEYKNLVFQNGFKLYIGIEKEEVVVDTYRVHKNYDLIAFKNYSNINEVLKYKGSKIYALKDSLNLKDDEYLLTDLIGMEVYDKDLLLGIVIDYEITPSNTLLKIKGNKTFYIPNIKEYIQSVNLKEKKIITNRGSDLIL